MFDTQKKILGAVLFAIVIFTIVPSKVLADNQEYDVVIKGGKIYNPSTEHELEDYNIGIIGSKIKRISKSQLKGGYEIDAEGLVVSPGFIDLISYNPNHVGIDFKVLDGVTTNLAMHGGTEDPVSWYRAWGNNGVTTNFGASSFITRLRWPIVGQGIENEIKNQEDIDKLVDETRKCIENGTLGISFSFEYIPGIKNEIKPLLELAAEYDVPTFYHLRYSDEEKGLEGIEEVIEYGKETGAAIHIMHINSTGGTFVMDQALDLVSDARNDGLDITSCFYPYDYWATYIDSARFRPGWRDKFKIDYEDLQIGATDIRITEETFSKYRQEHLLVAAHGSMPEEELIMLLKDPNTMIGSDTIIEPDHNNHPRGAGAYSRVFGKYVRKENVLSIMDAIKKVSYFPAKRMESAAPSMRYKGRLEVDADADITIFNPNTIIDKATVKNPATASEGVSYVLVNGVVVKDKDGLVKDKKPGKPIKSYFVDEITHKQPINFSLKIDEKKDNKLNNVYKINGKNYLPVKEIFQKLDVENNIYKDGKIKIGGILELEIGSNVASISDKKIQLSNEPIIYKEDIYLSVQDLKSTLSENYEVEESKNLLTLVSKETNEKYSFKDSDSKSKKNSDADIKTSKDDNKYSMYIIYAFLIIILSILFIIFKRKRR